MLNFRNSWDHRCGYPMIDIFWFPKHLFKWEREIYWVLKYSSSSRNSNTPGGGADSGQTRFTSNWCCQFWLGTIWIPEKGSKFKFQLGQVSAQHYSVLISEFILISNRSRFGLVFPFKLGKTEHTNYSYIPYIGTQDWMSGPVWVIPK